MYNINQKIGFIIGNHFVCEYILVCFFVCVLINKHGRRYQPACPRLMCFFNGGNIKETDPSKKNVFHVCVCLFCFVFMLGLVLRTDFKKGFTFEKNFEM